MKNIFEPLDATSNSYVEDEFPYLGETKSQVANKVFKDVSAFSNETLGGKFRKFYLSDEIYRIVKPALRNVGKIKNETVRNQAKDMISEIVDLIVNLLSLKIDINRVPPLHTVVLEDDSFLIEWRHHSG